MTAVPPYLENADKIAVTKVAIFDFDGIIVNPVFRYHVLAKALSELTDSGDHEGYKESFRTLKEKIESDIIPDLGDNIIHKDYKEILTELLQDETCDNTRTNVFNAVMDKLKSALRTDEYQEIIKEHTHPIKSGIELVKEYKSLGFKTILVTNQDEHTLKNQLEHLGIKGLFDIAKGNSGEKNSDGEHKTPKKPDPLLTKDALKKIGTWKDALILFHGDSIKDLLLNPDNGERRDSVPEKLAAVRKEGVQGYKKFRVVLISPDVDDEMKNVMTASERRDYEKAYGKGGGIGKRLGWYPDSTALTKGLEETINKLTGTSRSR